MARLNGRRQRPRQYGTEKERAKRRYLNAEERAFPVPNSNRHPWGDFSLLHSLTPERLAQILDDVKRGESPADFLELAQDIELKDPHYRSVLSTRKDAITGLEIKVVPAGEDGPDAAIAEAVERDIVNNSTAKIYALIRDMLDALAKGFSVSEIIWDTSALPWKPSAYKFRDPRWFQYDQETGAKLMLREPHGSGLLPLAPNKFVIHEPHLVSGKQITAGLAMPALYYWMLKSYNISSWAAFIDRYGYPIRLGRYGRKATEPDIATLKRAVAQIGQDFGAVIPESAQLEILEAKKTGEASGVYQKLADWVDRQVSKLVLGQTMTTDDGSSRAQGEVHDRVRGDIADSDIRQLEETLNASLTVPYVRFNFGERERYPKIRIHKPDHRDIKTIIAAVSQLGSHGLAMKADEMRSILGVANPEEGDELVGRRQDGAAAPALAETGRPGADEIDGLVEGEEWGDGWAEISDDVAGAVDRALNASTDFASLKKELDRLAGGWPAGKIAECVALATFKARALGEEV